MPTSGCACRVTQIKRQFSGDLVHFLARTFKAHDQRQSGNVVRSHFKAHAISAPDRFPRTECDEQVETFYRVLTCLIARLEGKDFLIVLRNG